MSYLVYTSTFSCTTVFKEVSLPPTLLFLAISVRLSIISIWLAVYTYYLSSLFRFVENLSSYLDCLAYTECLIYFGSFDVGCALGCLRDTCCDLLLCRCCTYCHQSRQTSPKFNETKLCVFPFHDGAMCRKKCVYCRMLFLVFLVQNHCQLFCEEVSNLSCIE